MKTATLSAAAVQPAVALPAEEQFYSNYDWCLNPLLSVRELFIRLAEELDRYDGLSLNWQREESRINIYLFACAIGCTVDDYLGGRALNLEHISKQHASLGRALATAQRAAHRVHLLRNAVLDRAIVAWRRAWDDWIDRACNLLIATGDCGDSTHRVAELRASARALHQTRLPERVLRRRLRLPEGYRCQDMTHQDITNMARLYQAANPAPAPTLVVGARTAGAYFAPLVCAWLRTQGWPEVQWLTLRPKGRLSLRERRRLRALDRPDVRVIVVDDYPNSGRTLYHLTSLLKRFGAGPERITLLVPRHPTQPDWTLPDDVARAGPVAMITLDPHQLEKPSFLAPECLEPLMREYFPGEAALVPDDARAAAINSRLADCRGNGFHVRFKRVFTVRLGPANRGESAVRRLLAKSVGWGWLGYHAFIAGRRLAGLVPSVVGLRHGLLFTEWLEAAENPPAVRASDRAIQAFSRYVAARARRLRLPQDPLFDHPEYSWNGWDEIVHILRAPYGAYLGRLMAPALRRALRPYVCPVPALVDGRMRPEEWVENEDGFLKLDFEHHNFSGPELDIVDPAYDLAQLSLEWQLSYQSEEKLLADYARQGGDPTIWRRIPLYRLLSGTRAMRGALDKLAAGTADAQHWSRCFLMTRSFLMGHMNRYCAALARLPRREWTDRLLFLDLDGVMDRAVMGFPHTTEAGLRALALLQSEGFSVVPNSERSMAEVYEYCRIYGLPGGVAELGSVFMDVAHGREEVLISQRAAEQLRACRQALRAWPGVLTDPEYRYAICAWRMRGKETVPLGTAETDYLLSTHRLDHLTFLPSDGCTYIQARGADKGTGMRAALESIRGFGYQPQIMAAIGDGEADIPMLEAAAPLAFAPANCAPAVRELARTGGCRIMKQSFQRGLLAAAKTICGGRVPQLHHRPGDILHRILRASDRP